MAEHRFSRSGGQGQNRNPPIANHIPLYREVAETWQPPETPMVGKPHAPSGDVLPTDAHHGLYWERFFHGYTADFAKLCEGDKRIRISPAKARFVFGFQDRKVGDAQALSKAAERLCLLAASLGGDSFDARNDWRFATGTGQEHPTENGLVFHRTLGAPYLPGSGVKGLLRGYLEWLEGVKPNVATPPALAERLTNWFGSPHKDPRQWPKDADSQSGWFIFFDALPLEPVRLKADVMTLHYGDWYKKGGDMTELDPDIVPADWHSPNPVAFLVAEKIHLRFAVAPRPGLPEKKAENAREDLGEVLRLLKEALQEFGAGAKTAVGYGLFGNIDGGSNS